MNAWLCGSQASIWEGSKKLSMGDLGQVTFKVESVPQKMERQVYAGAPGHAPLRPMDATQAKNS